MTGEATDVVQRQLDAFNLHDVDALLSTYSPTAELFEHPAKLLASGSGELRVRFTERFKDTALKADLLHRMAMGDTVIDHERILRSQDSETVEAELIAIYQVSGGKIARAWFMPGPVQVKNASGAKP